MLVPAVGVGELLRLGRGLDGLVGLDVGLRGTVALRESAWILSY